MTTASLRASATLALRIPARLATPIAHVLSEDSLQRRVRMTLAASYSAVRTPASPIFEIRPVICLPGLIFLWRQAEERSHLPSTT